MSVDKEKKLILNETYRRVFSTEEGKAVLTDILNDCGYFSLQDMNDPADIARLNVGRRILGKCGVWEPVHAPEITETTVRERTPMKHLIELLKLPIRTRSKE